MARYSKDPRWIVLKYDSKDGIPKGTRVFYYPATGRMLTGEQAEQAARDFEAAAADEAFMNGQ